MWSQKAAVEKKMMKKKNKTESGEGDSLGDSDTMTGEKSKQSQIRLSACTALTYLGLFEAPCFLLITSFLLLPQLFTISLLKVMIQDFQTLFTHSLLFCYHLSIYTALSIFHIFSALQKFPATSPTSEVKWGEWCQELTLGYCPGRCSLLSFKWSCFTQLSVLWAGRSLLPLS